MNLNYRQVVTVNHGNHKGKKGKVISAKDEGDSTVLNMLLDDGETICVDLSEIATSSDVNLDYKLFVSEEKHANWDKAVKEIFDHGNRNSQGLETS